MLLNLKMLQYNMKLSKKMQRKKIITIFIGLIASAHFCFAGVVVNEIVYKDDNGSWDSGDWFELFNDKNETKDISGWIIEDDGGNQFTNPPSTTIPPYGFLVFYCGGNKFTNTYPTVDNIVGPLPFKFGSNDTIIIRNSSGDKKNEVEYNDKQIWPDAYGNGHSIELMFPYQDNEKAANWLKSNALGGSPGVKNPNAIGIYVTEHDRSPDGPTSSQQADISITVKDAFSTLTSVNINVKYNSGSYVSTAMTPGANNQYGTTLPPTNNRTIVRYYFDFENNAGQTAHRFWSETDIPYLYVVDNNPITSGMIINEIMYNSSNLWIENTSTTSDYEYLEIFNYNTHEVDVSFWQFHDEGNKYRLPDSMIVPANGYIVIADKTQAIIDVYGSMPTNALLVSFPEIGLGNAGEEISWQNMNGVKLNYLTYDDKNPWPIEPDGKGPSLELKNWLDDNKQPENWESSTNFGTPGRENSVLVPEPFGFWIFNCIFLIFLKFKLQIN